MNIMSGFYPSNVFSNGTSAAKKTSQANININTNAVTAEYIVERIKALGVASVKLVDCDFRYQMNGGQKGYNLTITPTSLQRMIDDPVFREAQFEIIENNVKMVDDPRFIARHISMGHGWAACPTRIISGVAVCAGVMNPWSEQDGGLLSRLPHWGNYVGWWIPGGEDGKVVPMTIESLEYLFAHFIELNEENRDVLERLLEKVKAQGLLPLRAEDDATESIIEEQEYVFSPIDTAYDKNSHSLTQLLFQMHVNNYAAMGDLLLAKNEEHFEKSTVSYNNNFSYEKLPPGTTFIGKEGYTITRADMRPVIVEYGDTRWEALVTPDGVWLAKEGWQSLKEFVLLDISQDLIGIPNSVLGELEYLGKMMQHMPTQLINTNGVRHSHNMTISHTNADDSPADVQAFENVPQPEYPEGFLRGSLQSIVNAFAAVANGSQYSEAAFLNMLRNTPMLTANLARMNLQGEEAAYLEYETIEQMHEKAQRQIDLFGKTFLAKFKLYGLEDGFNVAWAALRNTA